MHNLKLHLNQRIQGILKIRSIKKPLVTQYTPLNFVIKMSHVHVKAICRIKQYASTYITLHKIHFKTGQLIAKNNRLLTSCTNYVR